MGLQRAKEPALHGQQDGAVLSKADFQTSESTSIQINTLKHPLHITRAPCCMIWKLNSLLETVRRQEVTSEEGSLLPAVRQQLLKAT